MRHVFVLIFLFISNVLFAENEFDLAPDGQPWIKSSIDFYDASAPQLDADWEWRQESYTVYWNKYLNTPTNVTSPFYSEITGGVAFTLDYEPDDGWELLYRNFGNSNGFIGNPYFVLYNKYQGLLRVFILTQAEENYTSASVQFYFDGDGENKTALLTHASNRAWAVDRYNEDNIFLSTSDMVNYHWMYVDYATAYDPNTSLINNSIITFELLGVELTNLKINGTINLTQELPKSGTNSTKLSEFDQLAANGKRAIGYYNTFNGLKKQLDKAKKKQKDGLLRDALDQLYAGWIPDALPYLGAAIGLYDFFVGGGRDKKKESPVPMVFNGDMELTGTLETENTITQ